MLRDHEATGCVLSPVNTNATASQIKLQRIPYTCLENVTCLEG